MHVTAAKDGVQGRRRLRIFAAAVALVLLCAVCVGGVSGEKYYASDEAELRYYIELANSNSGADTIIITDNIVLYQSTPITISNGQITIKSADGESYKISRDDSSYAGFILSYVYSPIFSVGRGGELVLGGTDSGSLILDGNRKTMTQPGGGAVYVNGGSFVMNDGVQLTEFGLLGSAYTGSGRAAVYVASGTFTMNGGLIDNNRAAIGGGVYVASGAYFYMTGGEITKNGHEGWWFTSETYGGGVYIEDDGHFSQSGDAKIEGNYGDPADIVYNDPYKTRKYTVHHLFYDMNGENVVEEITETAFGNSGEKTNAQPLSIPGYVNRAIVQQTIKADGSTVVEVYYDISISYTINIPTTLVIAEDTKRGSLPISLEDLWILENSMIVVSVDSKYDFHLAYVGDESSEASRISYNLKNGETSIEEDVYFAEFTLNANNPLSLTAEVTGTPPYKGAYNDVLTFTFDCIASTTVEN